MHYLLLTIETGIMVLGVHLPARLFTGFRRWRIINIGHICCIGLYLLEPFYRQYVVCWCALVFGMGVCYFWPTMLGFVSENLPKTGAVGMNLMGGAGMFAVSVYLIFMGGYYDQAKAKAVTATEYTPCCRSSSGPGHY